MTVRRMALAGAMLMAAWGGPTGHAAAGPYDGSRVIVCAVETIVDCDNSGRCERHLPDATAPRFMRVDVAGKTVTEGDRRSAIVNAMRVDGTLILQGGENGRGWSATINEDTGRMAAALIDEDYTFSLFGACAIP